MFGDRLLLCILEDPFDPLPCYNGLIWTRKMVLMRGRRPHETSKVIESQAMDMGARIARTNRLPVKQQLSALTKLFSRCSASKAE